jgi:simple sugar transport system ATP-binding protein
VKVLLRDAKVVVFDEPTAVLTPKEIIEFFAIVRTLIAAGRGVVFITHKLKEALTIADRISVLRRGKVVGEVLPKATSEAQIAEMMVGRPVQLIADKANREAGEVMLSVDNLQVVDPDGRAVVDGVSFVVRAGEIVGIAGVQGNGQTELVDAITGLRAAASGTISVAGDDVTGDDPRERHAKGMAHIPEDRQRQGLVGALSVAENLVLTRYHDPEFRRGLTVDWGTAHDVAERLIGEYDIRTPSADVGVGTLSGGNQQKVIVARELSRDLKVSVASQPTRGVDVGSIEYIHSRIVEERDAGTAVLIVSTELDEVMALSDRLLVMYRGTIVADLDPKQVSAMDVGLYMAGSRPGGAA